MIAETTKELNQLNFKVKQVEKDQYATRTTIAAKKKPLIEQMNALRYKLNEFMVVRDGKIPDHEKLPKDCVYYRHFMQVQRNNSIE